MILLGQKDGNDVYLLPQIQIEDESINFNAVTDFGGTLVPNLGGQVALPESFIDSVKAELNLD